MVAIIDYDAGNVKSVEKALQFLGQETVLTRDPGKILGADRVILPGVGAFGDAMKRLEDYGLVDVIRKVVQNGTPFLGICLGLQLLFESSEESPGVQGLGILKGRILRIPEGEGPDKKPLKIPHIGWNALEKNQDHPIWNHCSSQVYVYYVHSYYAKDMDPQDLVGVSEYGKMKIPGLVIKDNWMGCQFHPEKSGKDGLEILRYFLEDF